MNQQELHDWEQASLSEKNCPMAFDRRQFCRDSSGSARNTAAVRKAATRHLGSHLTDSQRLQGSPVSVGPDERPCKGRVTREMTFLHGSASSGVPPISNVAATIVSSRRGALSHSADRTAAWKLP